MPRYKIPVTLALTLPNDFAAKIVRGMMTASVTKMLAEGMDKQPMVKDAQLEVTVGDVEEIL